MKRRILSLLLLLSLLITPALAEDTESGFREFRPPTPFEIGPQWTEMSISIQSGDNTLRGTMTCPKQIEETMPVAILLHGLNTDRHWCDDIAWCLADHGIVSVRFDFNGSGLSDGAQEDMTITSLVADTLAILDYVEGLRFTDPDNIFLIGKSMGGVAAVMAAKERGSEINALCLWYPGFSANLSTKFGYFLGQFYLPWDPPETLEVEGYTYGRDLLLEAATLDFADAVSNCKNPVLIIHGDRDDIAPLMGSLWADSLFPNSELHVVPGGGHGFSWVPELFSLNDTLSFLQSHLR